MHGRVLAGIGALVLGLGVGLSLGGCSAAHYKASADREVYSIVKHKTAIVPGMPKDFTIDQSPDELMRTCPTPPEQQTAAAGAAEQGPVVISLQKALQIAAYNSRSYQSQKESVYLAALSLTAQRYRFRPHFFGSGSGDYTASGLGDEQEVSGSTDFGFSWLLQTGASLSVDLASDFSRFLTGSPRPASSSFFSATIAQPLLQGAGIAVTEPLTQAERDVVYQIRDFVQFRRAFFVQVLTDYYRVLENLKVLGNQQNNYNSLLYARNRAEALSRAGQLPPFQVDQAQQQLLQAEDSIVRAKQTYESSLDSFRVTLGLAPETDIELDPKELEDLTNEKAEELPFALEDAVRLALVNRLDLMTADNEVEDAARKVEVAANDLLPGVNLSAALRSSTEGTSSPLDFESDTSTFSAGFELDLPLDRLNERNTYRRSLISLEQSKRTQCQVRDGVVQDVRNTWRQFQRTSSSYRIAVVRIQLAKDQVESTELQLQAGRALVRDVLDAQEALLNAQNDLAGAVVDYRVARLDLAVNMDTLAVSETGQLKESFDEYFRPEGQ
jgi:outer membrane protein TolC